MAHCELIGPCFYESLWLFSDMVEQNKSPVDIMARRAIDVFHNSVIGIQVTLNTKNALVMSSSMAIMDEYKISTWDGIVDMDIEGASDCQLVRTFEPPIAQFGQSRSMHA